MFDIGCINAKANLLAFQFVFNIANGATPRALYMTSLIIMRSRWQCSLLTNHKCRLKGLVDGALADNALFGWYPGFGRSWGAKRHFYIICSKTK